MPKCTPEYVPTIPVDRTAVRAVREIASYAMPDGMRWRSHQHEF